MKCTIVEPFFSGSHRYWIESLQTQIFSSPDDSIDILHLPGLFWKWRMQMGAVVLAKQFQERDLTPNILLMTDMLDVPAFLSLIPRVATLPRTVLYFHENQLAYPWSEKQRNKTTHERYLGQMNIKSALAVDICCFNSRYNLESCLDGVERLLKEAPDYPPTSIVQEIQDKSVILPIGLKLPAVRQKNTQQPKTILWNHRWEHDKNPEAFFSLLFQLDDEEIPFRLIVLGEPPDVIPSVFQEAEQRLQKHIVHWGYVESRGQYFHLLQQADVLPVTSNHDFFGLSVLEAVGSGVVPLLPNRLVYPEHFPLKTFGTLFYESDAELLEKLRQYLLTELEFPLDVLYKQVSSYRWEALCPLYQSIIMKKPLRSSS